MADASEVLAAILTHVHAHSVAKQKNGRNGTHAMDSNTCSAIDCQPPCIAHNLFWLSLAEQVECECGATSELLVGEVQPAGKQKMPAQDFINGYRLQVGRSILG